MLVGSAWIAQGKNPSLWATFTPYGTRIQEIMMIVLVAHSFVSLMRVALTIKQLYVMGTLSDGLSAKRTIFEKSRENACSDIF